jgi:hypothetical protein
MQFNVRRLAFVVFIPIGVTACQNEPPAFIEQGLVPINLTVSEFGDQDPRGSEFVIDEEANDEATEDARANGPIMGYAGYNAEDGEAMEADPTESEDSPEDGAENGNTGSRKELASPETPLGSDDAAGIAAACGRHLKGFATRIRVISADEALTSLNIGPDTALAVRLSGRQSKLSLNLGAGQPLAGICFVMRGHESSAQFTTASDVKKLVYLAAGDESKGDIQIIEAALGGSRIELGGHAPGLSLKGVDSSECSEALVKNKSARIECSP